MASYNNTTNYNGSYNHYSIADSFVPKLFGDSVINQSTRTNRFINSGILTPDSDCQSMLLSANDNTMTMPFINDLGDGTPEKWSEGNDISVDNLSTGSQRMFRLFQAKAFGYTDLSKIVGSADPLDVIQTRFANWWTRADETTLLKMLQGVFGNSKIADSKMFDDSKNNFSAKGFQGAMSRLGDLQDNTTKTILVNSATYSQMKVNQMIDTFIPQNQVVSQFGTYNGMKIVVDDEVPIDSNGVSTSYIFDDGAVKWSVASPDNSAEIERISRRSGGMYNIINRRVMTTHVVGTTVAGSFDASNGVSVDDLANPNTWDVVVDPRYIRVVAYKAKVDSDFVPKSQAQSATTQSSSK